MFAHIIARDMGQAGVQMDARGLLRQGMDRVAFAQRRSDPAQAPGAAEIEAVEMRDLAIAAVLHGGGREERRGFALGQDRQEVVEPGGEGGAIQDAAHQQRFAQGG